MSLSFWMLTSLCIASPPGVTFETAPAPHLEKDLEITWRGTFSEAILRPNVRAIRMYEAETRLYVLEMKDKVADAALFASIKLKPDIKTQPEPAAIVRLELVRIEPDGKIAWLPGDSLSLPFDKRMPQRLPLLSMEGLPTFEPAVCIHFPSGPLRLGQGWDVPEPKRPPVHYTLEGTDTVRGARCLKVGGRQQTDDWNRLTSDSTAWRRGETLSVSLKHGFCARIERVTEKRDPQSGELGFRSKLLLEQAGYMRYPDRFGEDRRGEIAAAAVLNAELERAIADPNRTDNKPFEFILQRIERHQVTNYSGDSVPYREAVLTVKRKAEAARKGYIPPAPPAPETTESPPLSVGRAALDVSATDLTNRETVTLSRLRGRSVLFIYYQPSSVRTAEPVMRLANQLMLRWSDKAAIYPVAIGDNAKALQQRNQWAADVHLLAGRGIYKQHNIESTPCFVLIDGQGIVRSLRVGWSEENVEAVNADLERWAK